MAKKQHEEVNTEAWMATYSDLVTLLLTFFILLFSFSSVNADKWEMLVKALSNAGDQTSQVVLNIDNAEQGDQPFPNMSESSQMNEGVSPVDELSTLPTDFNDLYMYLQAYVESNDLQSAVEIMEDGDNVVYIRFQNNILFDPDKSYLRAEAREILDYLGDCLSAVQDQIYLISINGHTAEVANGEHYAVSDWMLSSERASNVAIYFDDQKDIEPTKLRPMGYGKNFPIAPNNTAEGREQNRRVDMTIIKDGGDTNIDAQLANLFDPTQFPKSGGVGDILSPNKNNLQAAVDNAAAQAADAQQAEQAPLEEGDISFSGAPEEDGAEDGAS